MSSLAGAYVLRKTPAWNRQLACEARLKYAGASKGDGMGTVFERPQAPARHRLDVGAFYRMAEAGILTHPQRVELIDGDIFDMNPIGSSHAAVTRRLEQRSRER
jgi:hypothetical protein